MHRAGDGRWRADWPEDEGYNLGPPSIAWLTWHVGFWWSIVLDRTFAGASLTRDDATWVNLGLTTNAAEIGCARFLHAVRTGWRRGGGSPGIAPRLRRSR